MYYDYDIREERRIRRAIGSILSTLILGIMLIAVII